ncbi:Ankyrin repeat domain-containing protein 1, partial [Durusdinium trenchii]
AMQDTADMADQATRLDDFLLGRSGLHRAAEQGDAAEVQRLIEAGADLELQDQTSLRRRPLHYAAEQGDVEVVQRLLAAKAAVEAEDGLFRQRPLHWAAYGGHRHVIERLLAAKADVEAQTESGNRPLHLAAREGHPRVVKRLLAANAEVEAENHAGETPFDRAKQREERTVMGVLRPVHVLLMSGQDVSCDPQPDRTVRELREEVQKKLQLENTKVLELIASSGEKLRDELTLNEANVDYGGFLSAIV